MAAERRAGNHEVLEAIRSHAEESRIAMTALGSRLEGVEKTVDRVGKKVDETAERVARGEANIDQLFRQNKDQYDKLNTKEGGESSRFGDAFIQRGVIIIVGVLVFGLLGLAGYKAADDAKVVKELISE